MPGKWALEVARDREFANIHRSLSALAIAKATTDAEAEAGLLADFVGRNDLMAKLKAAPAASEDGEAE